LGFAPAQKAHPLPTCFIDATPQSVAGVVQQASRRNGADSRQPGWPILKLNGERLVSLSDPRQAFLWDSF
jgi:hypothetical protein